MEFTQLGRTGLKVSRLCLGTMNFGPQTSEAESFAIMDKALELGINFFDTANVYGQPRGKGVTEELLGRWLAQGGGRRERIVLATKVYGPMGPAPLDRGLSARHIRLACDASLRRLGTDYIDLYQIHWANHEVPLVDTLQVLGELRDRGAVRAIGVCNFGAVDLEELLVLAQPAAIMLSGVTGGTHEMSRAAEALHGRPTFLLSGPRHGGLVGTPGAA